MCEAKISETNAQLKEYKYRILSDGSLNRIVNAIQYGEHNTQNVYIGNQTILKSVDFIPNEVNARAATITEQPIVGFPNAVHFVVRFYDLYQLQNLSKKQEEILQKHNCVQSFGQWVTQYILDNGGQHYSLMAQSLYNSCKTNEVAQLNGDVKQEIEDYIKNNGKNKICVFLSAITSINEQNTVEYYAAKYLSFALKDLKIGAFWWENNDLQNKKWPVSAKIATGLALSSIFVCLAYDSVQVQSNGAVNFTCFDGKISPCFNYEFKTFKDLSTNKDKFEGFVKGIDVETACYPSERTYKVFSYGNPINYNGCNAVFDNDNGSISITNINPNDDIKSKIKGIFKRVIVEIFEILSKKETLRSLCPKVKNCYLKGKKRPEKLDKYIEKLWKKADAKYANSISVKKHTQEDKYAYLYAPFDPNVIKFSKGKYYDNFLGPEWGVSTDPSKDLAWIKEGSKENIESIPIDYFFEYAIVDSETGKNAKNHFLVFPEKYNDEDGNFKWRLKLVVRDWNMCAIWDNNYRVYLTDINAKPINNLFNKKFFPLTQYSMIEFFKGKRAITSEYRPDGAVTDREYSDTASEGCIDSHGAYILNKDVFNENAPIYHLYGTLRLCNNDEQNYGKTFCISINFYPERVDYNKTGIKLSAISPSLSKTKARCPYCGRIKAEANIKKCKNLEYCDGIELDINRDKYRECEYNFVGEVYHLKKDTLQIVKSFDKNRDEKEVCGDFGDVFEKIKDGLNNKNTVMSKINNENLRLLYKSEYDDGVVVSMVGISQSGKSTIISKMFSVDKGNISTAYLANAMKPYCKNVEFITVQSKEMLKGNGNEYSALGISGLRLREDYKSPLYEKFLSPTPSGTDPVVTHIPYAIELQGIQSAPNRNIYMSFFDVPGSIFETDKYVEYNSDYTMLKRSDSIILLLDNNNADDKQRANSYMIRLMQDLDKNTIVAVVFCKADELFSIRDEAGNLIYDFSGDKSIVRHLSPVSKGNKYGGSKRQKYVDKCSKTIRDMMMNDAGTYTTKNNIRALERQFNKIKFFTVSSIGRSDSIIKKPGTSPIQKYVLYNTSPFNIENVLLWILYEKGIIE